MDKAMFEAVDKSAYRDSEPIRESLTYWQDAWRRLKKHKPAIAGLVGVIFILLFGVAGPWFSPVSYSDQSIDFANLPPRMPLYQLEEGFNVYLTEDYKVIKVSDRGVVEEKLQRIDTDPINKIYTYSDGQREVLLDFSYNLLPGKMDSPYDFAFIYEGEEFTEPWKSVSNKKYPFGTDIVGRSLLVRVMYGARISLTVAFVATLVNLLIGVFYGSLAAFEGGRTDNIMMRIVDIINSIPLLLIVILIMVIVGNRGLWTMVIALGSVYWVQMARLVRGQVLSLKEQEFVLAARALGVPRFNIISQHLIPNAIGPIIVSMTMMIPRAVFTEAFISFIGLGVSAPWHPGVPWPMTP
ncbi:ABC transporter permease [Salinispira pacifica]|uniref:ABC transporter permease n=1 Tax=Salinispira pacifica TaxID=1307761 RepID=UPI0003FB0A02|nr:ABC transporter permease [Salinispira pacifica]